LITALALFQVDENGGADTWSSAMGVGLIEEAGKSGGRCCSS